MNHFYRSEIQDKILDYYNIYKARSKLVITELKIRITQEEILERYFYIDMLLEQLANEAEGYF